MNRVNGPFSLNAAALLRNVSWMYYRRRNYYEAIVLKNVKLNTNYILIISTNSGLWRYQIGDIIEFTSTNPFRIIIKGISVDILIW